MLLADLALKDEGFGDLLPGAEAVILDEAHQVPDTAAQFFGQVWSVRQVQILLRDIAAEMLAAGVRAPRQSATPLRPSRRGSRSCAPVAPRARALRVGGSAGIVSGCAAGNRNAPQRHRHGAGRPRRGRRHRQLRAARRGALRIRSRRLRELSEDTGLRWVDANANGLLLHYTPFEIAERLREYVESRPCAWVFTSATLAIGEDFSHFAARIGLPEARTVRIDSPFDYRDQARIFLPPRMPEPQDPEFAARFIEACAPLLEASGGRAFLLYTSYRGLADGVQALKAQISQPAVSGAGAGRGAARSAAESLSRAGQCGAAWPRAASGRAWT